MTRILGADIATRSGFAIDDGRTIRVHSFKPRAKRPDSLSRNEISVEYEAELAEEFRDHVRSVLVAEEIEYAAYEEPRTRDFERVKTVVDTSSTWAGKAVRHEKERGSSNAAMLRTFGLCEQFCGVCQRLSIPTLCVSGDDWRKSFLGYSRAPRGTTDGRKYLKQAVIKQCRLIGIEVPNDDAADAAGVVFHLRGYLGLIRPGELALAAERQVA